MSKVGHSRLHFVINVYNGVATSASASVFGSRRERDVNTRGLESEELVDDNMIIDEHDAVFLSRSIAVEIPPGGARCRAPCYSLRRCALALRDPKFLTG
jgi:hypothetical protein